MLYEERDFFFRFSQSEVALHSTLQILYKKTKNVLENDL